MTAVIARIVLRYLAAFLVARGILGAGDGGTLASDPDVLAVLTTVLGIACAFGAEGWYWLAKRMGWST